MSPLALLPLLLGCAPGTDRSRDALLPGAWTGMALPCDPDAVPGALPQARLSVTARQADTFCGPGGWRFDDADGLRLDACFFEVDEDHPMLGYSGGDAPTDGLGSWAYVGAPSATVGRMELRFEPDEMFIHGVVEYRLEGFTESADEVAACEQFSLVPDGGVDAMEDGT